MGVLKGAAPYVPELQAGVAFTTRWLQWGAAHPPRAMGIVLQILQKGFLQRQDATALRIMERVWVRRLSPGDQAALSAHGGRGKMDMLEGAERGFRTGSGCLRR